MHKTSFFILLCVPVLCLSFSQAWYGFFIVWHRIPQKLGRDVYFSAAYTSTARPAMPSTDAINITFQVLFILAVPFPSFDRFHS
jgi:hypothetical protein